MTCAVKGEFLAKAGKRAKPLPDVRFRDALHRIAERQEVLSAADLRREIGEEVHRNTVGQWWRGESLPSGREMGWLVQALDMSLRDVEELVGPPPAEERRRQAEREKAVRRAQAANLRAAALDAAELVQMTDPEPEAKKEPSRRRRTGP
jgi:hypothetical protein